MTTRSAEVGTDLAIQSNGRIVAVGFSGNGSAFIACYRPDGSLDPSFEGDGIAILANAAWHAVVLQSGGRLLVGGELNREATLARYTQDGTLDPTFGGGDGLVTTDIDPSNAARHDRVLAIGFQPGGQIIAGAARRDVVTVLRYSSDGVQDPTFEREIDFPAEGSGWHGELAVQKDGKVVIAGTDEMYGRFIVRRLTAAGAPDPSFGVNGTVLMDSVSRYDALANEQYEAVQALGIRPDGRIVVSSGDLLARFLPNGKPDLSLDGNGRVGLDFVAEIGAVAFDERGRTLVGGGGSSSFVARLEEDGRLDARFASDGVANIDVARPRGRESVAALGLQPDGRVVTVGSAQIQSKQQLALVRLLGGTGRHLYCMGEQATYQGTAGPDKVRGFGVIVTLAGADQIDRGAGLICAGPGNDQIEDARDSEIHAGPGADRITIARGDAEVWGEAGNDSVIAHREGSDQFRGGAGNDQLFAGDGADRLFGGSGRDNLRGGAGTDQLYGGPGLDQLDAGPAGAKSRLYKSEGRVRSLFRTSASKIFIYRLGVILRCKRRVYLGGTGDSGTYRTRQVDSGGGIRINPRTGRFRTADPPEVGDFSDESIFEGTVTPSSIVGRYQAQSESSDQGVEETCTTGRPGHAWVSFTAQRFPSPRQTEQQ